MRWWRRLGRRACLGLACLLLATVGVAHQAAAGDGIAGRFDFYVLSLSWSPSYCKTAGPRASRQQCGGGRDYGFIVHGLWPQDARGYPESCRSPYPARVPRRLGERLFDIMPSMSLIGHEWRVHGTCSGFDQASYFALVRKARARITIPEAFRPGDRLRAFAPGAVEQAFIAANPGLRATGVAVTCNRSMIEEVRICLTKSLDFRSCAALDAKSCPLKSASLPGVE